MGCRTRRLLGLVAHAPVLLLLMALQALAQGPDNVNWTLSLQPASAAPGSQVLARLESRLAAGWHLYSMTSAATIPTTVNLAPNAAVENVRIFQASPKKAFAPN